MKKFYAIAAITLCTAVHSDAQTTITSANTFPSVGYADTFRVASGSNVGPSGNAVTWDFSALSATVGGTFSIVAPSSTPYAGTFPMATHAVQLNVTGAPGPVYDYYKIDGSGWSILATAYSTASPSNTYLANDKLRIPYPAALGNSKTDTFVKAGSSPDSYTITYDGFGTLKMPSGKIYNNVARMKYQWAGGEIAYNWFTTSPLFFVATWSQNGGGQFSFLGNNLPAPTEVGQRLIAGVRVSMFPNPAVEGAILQVEGLSSYNSAVLWIYDGLGRIVRSIPVLASQTHITRDGLSGGVYAYRLSSNTHVLAAGRLSFQ